MKISSYYHLRNSSPYKAVAFGLYLLTILRPYISKKGCPLYAVFSNLSLYAETNLSKGCLVIRKLVSFWFFFKSSSLCFSQVVSFSSGATSRSNENKGNLRSWFVRLAFFSWNVKI